MLRDGYSIYAFGLESFSMNHLEKRGIVMTKVRPIGVIVLFLLCSIFITGVAFSQSASPSTTGVDPTPIIVALINLVFPAIAGAATYLINANVKNKQMATLLSNAVQNAVGIVQQNAASTLQEGKPLVIPVDDPAIKKGMEYVLKHAKEAIEHFKIDPNNIGEKLQAKIGLASIQTNLAATASTVPGVTGPLAPVPAMHSSVPPPY